MVKNVEDLSHSIKNAFNRFIQAQSCSLTFSEFLELCNIINVDYPPSPLSNQHTSFYSTFRKKLSCSWKADSLFSKLDKRYYGKEYYDNSTSDQSKKKKVGSKLKVLVVGAGPCGLRTAIEMACLGAKVIVLEKRDQFSRNNILHLWPFLITDLKTLGAKKIYGRFCAGSIDHISIRQLQLILLKVSLILGVEIIFNVSFEGLISPTAEKGWTAAVSGSNLSVSDYEFDVIVGADGKRNTLEGFTRKEFRAKLAIGLTANFINHKSDADARVKEMSGVACIYNPLFFQNLNKTKGIDLENIVYYKGDTHYFVMTAKKPSLLAKGVIKQDYDDTASLLHYDNIDAEALKQYTMEAAHFSTENQLPGLEFAVNHFGQPDVALFDFTCMYGAENAALFREEKGRKLNICLVGDSLLEPFWPEGTGCARGFLASFDLTWMIREWCLKRNYNSATDISVELGVLALRHSVYKRLRDTKHSDLRKKHSNYTIDPSTRYQNINLNLVKPQEMIKYYKSDRDIDEDVGENTPSRPNSLFLSSYISTRRVSLIESDNLLAWCRMIVKDYDVTIDNFSSSWRNGRALCAIIHGHLPGLIDFDLLDPRDVEKNNQMAFDIAEKHLGITPVTTGKEISDCEEVDSLMMVSYLSQFYEIFKNTSPSNENHDLPAPTSPVEGKESTKDPHMLNVSSPFALLAKLSLLIKHRTMSSREKSVTPALTEDEDVDEEAPPSVYDTIHEEESALKPDAGTDTVMVGGTAVKLRPKKMGPGSSPSLVHKRASDRISCISNQLISQFQQNAPNMVTPPTKRQVNVADIPVPPSSKCCFCSKKLHVLDRLSAEGLFFHRECFACFNCDVTLRVGSYLYDECTEKFFCDVVCLKRAPITVNDGPIRPSATDSEFDGLDNPPDKADLYRTPERIELENIAHNLVVWSEEEVVKHNLMEETLKSDSSDVEQEEDDSSEEDSEHSDENDSVCSGSYDFLAAISSTSEAPSSDDELLEEVIEIEAENQDFSSKVEPEASHQIKIEHDDDSTDVASCDDELGTTPVARDHDEDAVVDDGSSSDDEDDDSSDDDSSASDDSNREVFCDSMPPRPIHISSPIYENVLEIRKAAEVSDPSPGAQNIASKPVDDDTSQSSQKLANGEPNPLPSDPVEVSESTINKPFSSYPNTQEEVDRYSAPNPTPKTPTSHASKKRSLPSLSKVASNTTAAEDTNGDTLTYEEKERRTKQRIESLKAKSLRKSMAADAASDVSSTAGSILSVDGEASKSRVKRTLPTPPVSGDSQALEDSDVRARIRSGARKKSRTLPKPPTLHTPPSPPVYLDRPSRELRPRKKRLAVKLSRATRKTEEAASRLEKLEAQERLYRAQTIQRRLQEFEVKQKNLEERGIELEAVLRSVKNGEEDPKKMQDWFKLVQEKNALLRYEYMLMIKKRQLQLDEEHSRLERELRKCRSCKDGTGSSRRFLERKLYKQIIDVLEQRDELIAMLEEQNHKVEDENVDLETIISGNITSFSKQNV